MCERTGLLPLTDLLTQTTNLPDLSPSRFYNINMTIEWKAEQRRKNVQTQQNSYLWKQSPNDSSNLHDVSPQQKEVPPSITALWTEVQKHQKHSWHIRKQLLTTPRITLRCKDVSSSLFDFA